MTMPTDSPSAGHLARLREEEFAALRATIRERGSRRHALVIATLAAWGGLATVAIIWLATPGSTLIPMFLLAAGFEAGFSLHVGVERIGRYLQVEYESDSRGPAWEHAAMRFGEVDLPSAGRVDPLFSGLYLGAFALNLTFALLAAPEVPEGTFELLVVALLHIGFMLRVLRARGYASRQRELDLAVFRRVQTAPTDAAGTGTADSPFDRRAP